MFVATGQNALTSVGLLQRLQGRFPMPVELQDTGEPDRTQQRDVLAGGGTQRDRPSRLATSWELNGAVETILARAQHHPVAGQGPGEGGSQDAVGKAKTPLAKPSAGGSATISAACAGSAKAIVPAATAMAVSMRFIMLRPSNSPCDVPYSPPLTNGIVHRRGSPNLIESGVSISFVRAPGAWVL